MKSTVLIGYSGHSYVAFDIFYSQDQIVRAYTDKEKKSINPFELEWLGDENNSTVIEKLKSFNYFVSVGNNSLREKISKKLISEIGLPVNAIHKNATIGSKVAIGHGNMFATGVIINPMVRIGNGVICNTGSIIEHDCIIGNYAHIAPGAVLCGNVKVGEGSFVGANSVIKQGIEIGKNVIIGAGSVVLKDIPCDTIVYGNPVKN
jgi:sugar O-acyltransferase (sialic acid O-acetyltransferase NeuD family)